jgi:peptide/nickel transport system permease protein
VIRYLAKRLAWALMILVGVSIITFAINFVIPSDPVAMIAARNATKADRDRLRHELGLDQPILAQYGRYMAGLAQGDLGRSYKRKTQVAAQIWARLPATLVLMAAAIGFELLIGLPAGLYAARRRGTGADKAAMILSFIGVSSPQFVTGLILFYIFAYWLNVLPTGGYGGVAHVILPAVTLGIAGGGWYSRMMRSSMVDVLRQDYIRTARAKGLSEGSVLFVHAFRNAALPIVAMIGLDIGIFMSGVVVVESVYGWPGIGQLMWQAIQDRDIPIIMGVTLTAAVFIVLGNLLADAVAPLIDPRIRLR